MTNLKSIAQVNYDQLYPSATWQASVKVEHFIEEAKVRYAWEMWRLSKEIKRVEGEWEIPSVLWRNGELEVNENIADISGFQIFRSLDGDTWLGNLGGIGSDCEYVRMSVNTAATHLDDEYIGNSKPYVVAGSKIHFPKGVFKSKIPFIYASNGNDLDDSIEVDDAMAALVSDYLFKKFSGKMPEDKTENDNSNK